MTECTRKCNLRLSPNNCTRNRQQNKQFHRCTRIYLHTTELILFYFTKSRQSGAIFVDPSTVQLYLDGLPPVESNFILKLLLELIHESAIKKLNTRQSKVLESPTASRSKVNQSLLLNRKKLPSFSPGFYSLT